MTHGDLCVRFLKAYCPQAIVEKKEVRSTKIVQEFLNDLEQIFNKLLNVKKYDAVSMSIGIDTPYEENQVTKSNIKNESKRFRKNIESQFNTSIFETIKKVVFESKTPVYISDTNQEENFNLFNLSEGTINVGGFDSEGNPNYDHSLINRREKYIFNITKVKGGFDINEDGICDVKDSEVSGGEPIIKKFTGKKLKDVIATDKEILDIKRLGNSIVSDKLLPLKKLLDFKMINLEAYNQKSVYGEYVSISNNGKLNPGYRVDKKGIVYYDPANSGYTKNIVNYILGNSFATPMAVGKDMNKLCEAKSKHYGMMFVLDLFKYIKNIFNSNK